jgi:hypothetical protein
MHTRIPEAEHLPEHCVKLLRAHVLGALSALGRARADALDAFHLAGHLRPGAAWEREEQVAQDRARVRAGAGARGGYGARLIELFVKIGDGCLTLRIELDWEVGCGEGDSYEMVSRLCNTVDSE